MAGKENNRRKGFGQGNGWNWPRWFPLGFGKPRGRQGGEFQVPWNLGVLFLGPGPGEANRLVGQGGWFPGRGLGRGRAKGPFFFFPKTKGRPGKGKGQLGPKGAGPWFPFLGGIKRRQGPRQEVWIGQINPARALLGPEGAQFRFGNYRFGPKGLGPFLGRVPGLGG